MRRWLGFPALRRRTVLLIVLLLAGLVYASVTVLADFFWRSGQYRPSYYEPKDFQRESTR
jgi:hypothetical protein